MAKPWSWTYDFYQSGTFRDLTLLRIRHTGSGPSDRSARSGEPFAGPHLPPLARSPRPPLLLGRGDRSTARRTRPTPARPVWDVVDTHWTPEINQLHAIMMAICDQYNILCWVVVSSCLIIESYATLEVQRLYFDRLK